MKFAAALFALALATTASAQTTWKGLHFGDSRDKVRATLAAQNFDVETSQEGSLQSVTDYLLVLPGQRRALPLRADFRFTDAGGLMDITLWLDLRAMKQDFSELSTDDALLAFAADRLTRSLTDIYAAPLSKSSGCDEAIATAKGPLACTVNWHATGQSVALDWFTRPPHLFIRYQMLAADL